MPGQLEPEAMAIIEGELADTTAAGGSSVALVSIAISLKRIADAITPQPSNDVTANAHQLLCSMVDLAENNEMHMSEISVHINGVPYDPAPGADNSKHRMGLTDGIMHAIEQGLIAGRNG